MELDMKINFYGNSLCGRNRDEKFDTWVDRIITELNCDRPEYIGIAQCSEERILFNLKKSEPFDLAIIMHGEPGFIFCPTFQRDLHKQSNKVLQFNKTYDYYPGSLKDEKQTRESELIQLTPEETKQTVETYQKYFYTPETNRNRFYGALIQIDQYLKFKNIPTIHCPQHRHDIPKWFTFTSGPVLYDIATMQHDNSPYYCGYNKSSNAVNEEGNEIIFNKILEQINLLIPSK